jgi:hypothetical protein
MKTVARDGNYLLQSFGPCVAFEIIQENMLLRIFSKGR